MPLPPPGIRGDNAFDRITLIAATEEEPTLTKERDFEEQPESQSQPFPLAVERRGEVCLVVVKGEFDLRCAKRLEALVDSLRDVGEGGVVLDLAKVSFIDSSGVRAILAIEARSRREGFDFAIVPGGGQVERVFRVTGLDRGVRLIERPVEGPEDAGRDAGGGTRTPTGLKPTSS